MAKKGVLYLIPNTLGEGRVQEVLPDIVPATVSGLRYFVVENSKEARRFIKKVSPDVPQTDLVLSPLHKHIDRSEIQKYLDPCLNGVDMGLVSDAGVPGVADPGAEVVELAHKLGIQVRPLVGPSSILLAMMSSGLNGQSFAFNGYLPIEKSERKKALIKFERRSKEEGQSQAFIETPYRNNKLFEDFTTFLNPSTSLCVAADLTLESEFIKTHSIAAWKKMKFDLHKRPAIFILQA
jgi:16S rRNA (cytidine1402-2'-O)-methyltransferase